MKRAINLFKTKKDYDKSFNKLPIISLSYIEEIDKCKCIVKKDFSQYQYVTFRAEEDNSTIGLEYLNEDQVVTLEYSTDATTWNNMDTSTTIKLDNIDDEMYVRGIFNDLEGNGIRGTQFKMTGKIAAYGNCNAIWNYQDLNAPLKKWCGNNMFLGCSSLTKAPELPSTMLADRCYSVMFRDCTSLTTAPELPATVLTKGCYFHMFHGCSSLTKAPDLLCQNIEVDVYPYNEMFGDCISLNYIKCLLDIQGRSNSDWVKNVSPTGTFVKRQGSTWKIGEDGIPTGWTVIDAEITPDPAV